MPKVKSEVNEKQVAIMAARYANGVKQTVIATEFGVSRFVVQRCLETEAARKIIQDICYDKVALELAQNRRAVAELLPKAVEVILDQLEKKNLKAAELVIRASGMMQQESKEENKQQQAIQVILPGAMGTKDVVAE